MQAAMTAEDVHALPIGHQLNHYKIEAVIGRGGFGITYQAQDTVLRKTVAVKEYLPVEFAVRVTTTGVRPRSRKQEEDFRWGLERFLDEARTLARFRHPHLVPVLVYFEANGTAYMVMEFERGRSLAEVLADSASRRKLIERLPNLIEGLLSALGEVHGAGFLHRDIKPANIILRPDGLPVLVDFGSARHAVGMRSRTLTSIVTPRYAPIEQYALDGRQGPWTDLYGFAAVLHHVIVGDPPPEAVTRVRDDPYRPLGARDELRLPHRLLEAIDRSLAVYPEQRPQSVAAFQALTAGVPMPDNDTASLGEADENAPTRIVDAPRPPAGPARAERPANPAVVPPGAVAGRPKPQGATDSGPAVTPGLRAPDPALRALGPEDRILQRPTPRRGSLRGVGVLLLIGAAAIVGGLYALGLVPWLPRPWDRPVIVAEAPGTAGVPRVPAGQPATPPGAAAPAAGSGQPVPPSGPSAAGTPPQAGSPTPQAGQPGQAGRPPASQPQPGTPGPVASGGNPGAPPATAPRSGQGTGPAAAQPPAPRQPPGPTPAQQARQKAIEEADKAALDARARADRAAAAAARAQARAGDARIRAAEAAKVDLEGAQRVAYTDGAVYVGQLVDGRRGGLGVVELANGERQAGEWRDDRLNGVAVVTLPDGRRYEGEWKNGMRDGFGVFQFPDGSQVIGEHTPGGINGYAVWRESGRERAGVWRDGKLEGFGVETAGNEKYEGEMRNGLRHGRGVLLQADKTRFQGMFADGKRDGYGVETRADGTTRSGTWRQDSLVTPDP